MGGGERGEGERERGRCLESLINSGFKEKKKLKMTQRAELAFERERKKRC